MDIAELDNLETSVQDLLSAAEAELQEQRLQQQRDAYVQKATEEIQQRLKPLLEKIETMLARYQHEGCPDTPMRQKLEAQAADLRRQLEEAPILAAEVADRQLILSEERLLEGREVEQISRWQKSLRVDLLEMIAEQTDFYSATDAAIAVKGYLQDLKAIGALEEVVEALMDQINSHSEEGPVAKLRGSHEQTLNFIYNKALENRSRVERPPNVQPRVRHRPSEKPPNPYDVLEGKVVIFGGHDRLATAVRNRLRSSKVELLWCTAQDGLQMAEQLENHIHSADLVLVVTGYASHALTEKAMQAAQRANITPEIINTTGMIRVLNAIEVGLKTKQLARYMNQYSKPA